MVRGYHRINGPVGNLWLSGTRCRAAIERYQKSAQYDLPTAQYLFGRVKYHDHIESAPELLKYFTQTVPLPGFDLWPNVLDLALHKRSCYSHENEWRAVVYQDRRLD